MNDPDRTAQCAVLAMLFELSSSPKPGNVDRCHDFSDIGFHHFLASAVSSYPVFRKAAQGLGRPGSLILEGVRAWRTWNLSSNTHFGSLVLMIPIALAAGTASRQGGDLEEELAGVLGGTTVQDAIDFYRAFESAGARVTEVELFSLLDTDSENALCQSKKTLQELMKLSMDHDIVAREWATNYRRSFLLAERLAEQTGKFGLNDGIVRTFLEALAEVPDSLISAKFGPDKARQVSRQAALALEDSALEKARQMDCDLLGQDINPGSTADLIAASLFISLLRDLRF
jgi:triphosphoribosyl-dephospho-CoA synthase